MGNTQWMERNEMSREYLNLTNIEKRRGNAKKKAMQFQRRS